MDLDRFVYGVSKVADESEHAAVTRHFQELLTSLQAFSAAPGKPSAEAFRRVLDAVRDALAASPLNAADADTKQVIDTLGVAKFIGSGLALLIASVLAENQMAPALAVSALTELQQQVVDGMAPVYAINSAFNKLGIDGKAFRAGDAEIELQVPVPANADTLAGLSQEAKEWGRILETLAEVFDPNRPVVRLSTVATGSWQFYLVATPAILQGLLSSIRSINAIIAELAKTREQLSYLAATSPAALIEPLLEHNSKQYGVKFEELAIRLVEAHYKGDDGRKNELIVSTKQSLQRLAKKLASGSKVRVRLEAPKKLPRAEPTSEAETEAETEALRQLDHEIETADTLNAESAALTYDYDAVGADTFLPAPENEGADLLVS